MANRGKPRDAKPEAKGRAGPLAPVRGLKRRPMFDRLPDPFASEQCKERMYCFMKNLMKRSAAVVLALVMCIGMLNLTAFASDLKYGDVIGTCSVCGDPTYYVGVQDWQGYGFQCYKCGNYGYVSTPGSYQPPETLTGNVCPSCGKESYVLVAGDDVYCDQNYCPSCNYNPKPTHNFGPDGDSAECTNGCGYQNPNYVPLPANVYKAECGGTFRVDEVDGTAVLTVLTKGTSCVDVNVHDHQCDFCHA